MANTYTCAMCHGTFNSGRSEDAAEAEYAAVFPNESASQEPRDVVCDDCWQKIRPDTHVHSTRELFDKLKDAKGTRMAELIVHLPALPSPPDGTDWVLDFAPLLGEPILEDVKRFRAVEIAGLFGVSPIVISGRWDEPEPGAWVQFEAEYPASALTWPAKPRKRKKTAKKCLRLLKTRFGRRERLTFTITAAPLRYRRVPVEGQ